MAVYRIIRLIRLSPTVLAWGVPLLAGSEHSQRDISKVVRTQKKIKSKTNAVASYDGHTNSDFLGMLSAQVYKRNGIAQFARLSIYTWHGSLAAALHLQNKQKRLTAPPACTALAHTLHNPTHKNMMTVRPDINTPAKIAHKHSTHTIRVRHGTCMQSYGPFHRGTFVCVL